MTSGQAAAIGLDTVPADPLDGIIERVRAGARLVPTDALRGASLIDRDLSGANLDGADLSRSVLRDVDLRASQVSRASFEAADLRGSKLGGVRVAIHAKWIDADIADVDFCGAYLVRRQILDQNYLHEFRRQSRVTEAVYWIWSATSDCSRSFVRWGLWTAVHDGATPALVEHIPDVAKQLGTVLDEPPAMKITSRSSATPERWRPRNAARWTMPRPFVSIAPLPCSTPSRISPDSGSVLQ